MLFRWVRNVFERMQIARQVRLSRKANRRVAVEEELPAYGISLILGCIALFIAYVNTQYERVLLDRVDEKMARFEDTWALDNPKAEGKH